MKSERNTSRNDTMESDGILIMEPRKKRHLAWEDAERELDGLYGRYFNACRKAFPSLSPMECRVCALAKARLPNWRVAEILKISERTVENHFRSVRKKLDLPKRTRMIQALAAVDIQE